MRRVRSILAFALLACWATAALAQGDGAKRVRNAAAAIALDASSSDMRYMCRHDCGSISDSKIRYFCRADCGSI